MTWQFWTLWAIGTVPSFFMVRWLREVASEEQSFWIGCFTVAIWPVSSVLVIIAFIKASKRSTPTRKQDAALQSAKQ